MFGLELLSALRVNAVHMHVYRQIKFYSCRKARIWIFLCKFAKVIISRHE